MAENNLQDKLKCYYMRLFPFTHFYRWLSYGDRDIFARREFSYTIRNEIYIRFKSYMSFQQFEKEVRRLIPFKIDIGAVYNVYPSQDKKGIKFRAVERELVFDIDMTDYDDIRICCSGASVCPKCWKYMVIACKVLDQALREDFGFKHLLWVFSGRRGIHCWVCDENARKMDGIMRTAVAEYLQLVTGGEFMAKKVNLPGDKLHHSISRAVQIIKPTFEELCVIEQDMLGTGLGVRKFLSIIPESTWKSDLKALFDKCKTSQERWQAFLKYYENQKPLAAKGWRQSNFLVEEIMLQYCYPRLDINVSKGLNHLLKAPFCIHPKTGNVCVPFNPKVVEKFDPFNVPTIDKVFEEINEYDAKEKALNKEYVPNARIKGYKKTSLNKHIHIFQEFLWKMEESQKGQKIIKSDMTMEF
ncbi:DNA primase small subunit isoform X2 [Orussus abietinus]|uniref:DNA primase small subunit isoform X2 n=1 Tax=Orussus abietinus TaxID=222816 RepID=UPI000625FC04|nr:DNA primase small subunit isoform X2 [Orussus abietinus]